MVALFNNFNYMIDFRYFKYKSDYDLNNSHKSDDICFIEENGTIYTHEKEFGKTNYIKCTYATLKSLKEHNALVTGAYYQITDYVATAVDTGEETSASIVRSANHPFDIIVQAVATNRLSEEGKAIAHSGDTYFVNCNLNAWKIWYCLDNDTSRFLWADSTGKGVIYRMIDEYNNDIPYDFKGLQFKRFAIATTYDLSGAEAIVDLPIGHKGGGLGYTINEDTSKWYYTFSKLGNNWSDDVIDASLNGCAVEVVFTSIFSSNPRQDQSILLDNVFAYGQPVRDLCSVISGRSTEPIGDITYFSHMTFTGANCAHNTFVAVPALSRMGATFRKNLIIGSFRHLEIGSNFQNNTFVMPYDFAFGSIGEGANQNIVMCKDSFDRFTIGNYFINNRLNLSGVCQIASFGNYFYQNRITGESFSRVTFESNVGRNTFTSIDLSSVQMCGQLLDCTFSGKFMACTFNPICGYVDFVGGTNGEACVNLDIVGGIRGTSANRFHMECSDFIAQDAQGVQRRIRCEGDTNGNAVISWMSNGDIIRKTKGPSGAIWTDAINTITLNWNNQTIKGTLLDCADELGITLSDLQNVLALRVPYVYMIYSGSRKEWLTVHPYGQPGVNRGIELTSTEGTRLFLSYYEDTTESYWEFASLP